MFKDWFSREVDHPSKSALPTNPALLIKTSRESNFSFNFIKKGSEVLVKEFPSGEDFKDTKEKIEKF